MKSKKLQPKFRVILIDGSPQNTWFGSTYIGYNMPFDTTSFHQASLIREYDYFDFGISYSNIMFGDEQWLNDILKIVSESVGSMDDIKVQWYNPRYKEVKRNKYKGRWVNYKQKVLSDCLDSLEEL